MGIEPCTHHWRIKLPNGPTSEGVCLYCGERRDFKNSVGEWVPARKRSVQAHSKYSTADSSLRWQEVYRRGGGNP